MKSDPERWASARARDRELVRACLSGDEVAWNELWVRYGPVVKAVARRTGCDPEEARDVLQRVALVALQGLDRLREPEKLPGWLAGVARYQAKEVIRQRRPGDELYPWSAVDTRTPEDALERDQRLAQVRQALYRLDERCRRLIQRLDIKEPRDSYEEVAAGEGLAPSSIGPIRRRCLRRLKKILIEMSRSCDPDHW